MHSKKELLRERLQEKFFAAGKKVRRPTVLILGLGAHGGGVGAARFFCRLGYRVVVTDLKTREELARSLGALKGLPITFVLGKHRLSDITSASLIVKNPGVPARSPCVQEAMRAGVPITNDGELFLQLVERDRVIGITGTKGKTTTTLLLKHVLGPRARAVGVPGSSFFDYFFLPRRPRWVIAEFSSFDLEYASASPHIAIITALFADHLNRYRSFRQYTRVKMNLFRYQQRGDLALAPSTPAIKKVLPATSAKKFWAASRGIYVPGASWEISPISQALVLCVAQLIGISPQTCRKRIASFNALPGRLEVVARRSGKVFINDTTATNPGAAMFSLALLKHQFPRSHITVITGGEDKKFPAADIRQFAALLRRERVRVITIPGSMTEKLLHALSLGSVERARTLTEAVTKAADTRGVVALIPAAASFNMFQNEFDRAEKFKKAVRKVSS